VVGGQFNVGAPVRNHHEPDAVTPIQSVEILADRPHGPAALAGTDAVGIDDEQEAAADSSPPCTEWAQPGLWLLEVSDVQELARPIPARGQLGPWRPTEDLVDPVLQQLPDLRP
jgi:hypothetical protein